MSEANGAPVALVTGAATGIGAACARELAQAGFSVGIHFNTSESAAHALSAQLPGSFLLKADVSIPAGVDSLYAALKDKATFQVLVNNAGIAVDAPLFMATLEDVDRVLATNLKSAWYLTKRLSRLMIRHQKGRIINISSVVASTGNATQSAYGMAKAAIDNLTKTAAIELAPYNILVNSVAPGFIATRMTESLPAEAREAILRRIPLGRMGEPAEVAKLVRFLAAEGSYCTGSVFHVNGGMYGG